MRRVPNYAGARPPVPPNPKNAEIHRHKHAAIDGDVPGEFLGYFGRSREAIRDRGIAGD